MPLLLTRPEAEEPNTFRFCSDRVSRIQSQLGEDFRFLLGSGGLGLASENPAHPARASTVIEGNR